VEESIDRDEEGAGKGECMILSDRLLAIRGTREMTQADVAERMGVSEFYVGLVENGHTVPSIEILEKWAVALSVPVCQLFYDGEEPPLLVNLPGRLSTEELCQRSASKTVKVQ
jgi:transcriptional regulator with XRE-family HTH domain